MAKVRQIEMDDAGEYPTSVTVKLSSDEALFIALFTGKLNYPAANEILPAGGGEISSEIYHALVGDFFNRFYDDGVDDAKRAR